MPSPPISTLFPYTTLFRSLPKDYVRYRLSNELQIDYSDAAGTLLLDVPSRRWSQTICDLLDIDINICPPLVASHDEVGTLTSEFRSEERRVGKERRCRRWRDE